MRGRSPAAGRRGGARSAQIWALQAPSGPGRAGGGDGSGVASGRRGRCDAWLGDGGDDAGLLHRGRRGLTGPLRAWLGQGWPGMPRYRVRTATATVPEVLASRTTAVEVVPSRSASVLLLPPRGASLRSSWPRVGVRSEAAWVTAQPRWRMVVGGGLAGRLRSVGRWGLEYGRNPCRSSARCGDTCGCHHSFLEGVGDIHPPPPSACRGNPRTCPGSSVIGVAFFLGGVVLCAMVRSLGL